MEQTLVQHHALKPSNGESFDLIIIGAGPAGMSAAICAGRAKLKTLILEKALPGGQATTAYKISNYLGFPSGILGDSLTVQMEKHMGDYNLYYSLESAEDIFENGPEKIIKTDNGTVYITKAVIIAAGLEPKKMGSEFEKKFLGRGISYYAQGDVSSYEGKDVAVIGGGNCACYAADYLSAFVNQLFLIHRSDSLKAVSTLKEKVLSNPKIHVIWNSELVDIFGLEKVEKIKIKHVVNEQHTWMDVKGVFVYVGRMPSPNLWHLNLRVDESGYIVTDEYMRTSMKGVYAAGDIRSKQIRQIATAVSDGMIAAINVERDLTRS